jgi:hypothetical protein
VAALLIVGCESDGDEPVGDAGIERGPGGSVLDAPANPAALQPIWGPSSQHLEIRWSAVFGGSSRFAASREQQVIALLGRQRPRRQPGGIGRTRRGTIGGDSSGVVGGRCADVGSRVGGSSIPVHVRGPASGASRGAAILPSRAGRLRDQGHLIGPELV